ncbi:MAG: hypothetical protein DYG93_08660 [Leptolyngbya sp. PLA2]|nr:hypothetical protein [Leptolyngbya sp.]MCE7971716.1 hypothetical protein [Leptolyngbya sp. PL-A2]GIK19670.1 MAG: hypothetical protein BroJett004_18340 [Planctomycetota bacterium]
MPAEYVSFVAFAFPIAEVAIGLGVTGALVLGKSVRASATTPLAVYSVFFAYALWLTQYPPDQPAACGCGFSSAPVDRWGPIALRNGAATAVLVACALLPWKQDQVLSRPNA